MYSMDLLLAAAGIIALLYILRSLLRSVRRAALLGLAAACDLLATITGLIARALRPRSPSPRNAA